MTDVLRADVVKKGDGATLRYRANAVLTGASPLVWLARTSPDGPVLLSRPASIVSVDATTTVVEVELTPTETTTVGLWLCEIEATLGGVPHTFPSEGYVRLKVMDDLS